MVDYRWHYHRNTLYHQAYRQANESSMDILGLSTAHVGSRSVMGASRSENSLGFALISFHLKGEIPIDIMHDVQALE